MKKINIYQQNMIAGGEDCMKYSRIFSQNHQSAFECEMNTGTSLKRKFLFRFSQDEIYASYIVRGVTTMSHPVVSPTQWVELIDELREKKQWDSAITGALFGVGVGLSLIPVLF